MSIGKTKTNDGSFQVQSFRCSFENMSSFFAVLLLLLNAVVCQAAPTQNENSNPEVHDSGEDPVSETVESNPTTELSPPPVSPPPQCQEQFPSPPASPNRFPPPTTPPSASPFSSPPPSPLPRSPPPSLPFLSPPPSPLPRYSFSPQPQFPPSPPPQSTPPHPFTQPEFPPKPTLETPQCPHQVPPCPPHCQALPVPVPPSQQPPKRKSCWLMNMFNKLLKAVVTSMTDLIVVTGEKPPAKPRKRDIFVSFGKKDKASKQPKNCDGCSLDPEDDRAGKVGCFWYRDLRYTAPPRTHIASCATNPNGYGKQYNFCCVGHKVIDCSNCLTINCNPTINCCSCTINVTVVVDNNDNTQQQN